MKSRYLLMLTVLATPLLPAAAEHRICQRSLDNLRKRIEQELATGQLSEQTKVLLDVVRAHAELRKHVADGAPFRVTSCPLCSEEFLKEAAEHYVGNGSRTCPLCHRLDSCKLDNRPKSQDQPTAKPTQHGRPTANRPQAQGRPTTAGPRQTSSSSKLKQRPPYGRERENARVKFSHIKERTQSNR